LTDLPFYLIASAVIFATYALITGIILILYLFFRLKLSAVTTMAAVIIPVFVMFFDEIYIRVKFSDFCSRNVGVQIKGDSEIDSLELRGNFSLVSFGALIKHVDYVDFAPNRVTINRQIKRALTAPAYRLSEFSQFGEECSFFRRILRMHPTEDISRFEGFYSEAYPNGGCIGLIEIDHPDTNYYAYSEKDIVDGRILYRKLRKSGIIIKHSENDEQIASVLEFSIGRGWFFSGSMIGPTLFKDTLRCDTRFFTHGIVGLSGLLDEYER